MAKFNYDVWIRNAIFEGTVSNYVGCKLPLIYQDLRYSTSVYVVEIPIKIQIPELSLRNRTWAWPIEVCDKH